VIVRCQPGLMELAGVVSDRKVITMVKGTSRSGL